MKKVELAESDPGVRHWPMKVTLSAWPVLAQIPLPPTPHAAQEPGSLLPLPDRTIL